MKFILNSASSLSGRLGKIVEIHRLPGVSLETPLFMLHTRGGSIPNITYEVLQMIFREPIGVQVPLTGVLYSENAVREFKKGLADFIGLKEYLIYCTVQDSAEVLASGFNDRNTISVFGRKGREQVDPDRYMNIMEAFCPDMYQALSDGDTSEESRKKRITNAVTRTLTFTKSCLKRHLESEVLRSKAILGVIEGGYNAAAREECAKDLKEQPFSGFVIDGLHKGGPSIENVSIDDIKPIIEKTLKYLPADKFRIIHGCWNPEVVLDLVEMGVDIFDGSYPYAVSERGSALIFCNQICDRQDPRNDNKVDKAEDDDDAENDIKKKYEISLKNKRYFDDFEPISSSCSCFVCKEHSRSYIHHLLMTKELLGTVLLTVHNLHHYSEFFKTIRMALKEERWQDFRKHFQEETKVS